MFYLDLVLLGTFLAGGAPLQALLLGVLCSFVSSSGAATILFWLLHSSRSACHLAKLIFCLAAHEQTAQVFKTKHQLGGISALGGPITTLS